MIAPALLLDLAAGPRPSPGTPARLQVVAPPRRSLDLEPLAVAWQRALDSAEQALFAASDALPAAELEVRRRALMREREQVAGLLTRVARIARVRPEPWLSPVPVTLPMLGLAPGVRACLFDLDGVLTDSGALQTLAWAEVFDEFLLRVSEKAGRHFVRFDPDDDYRAYIDGRTRLEGVHAFLDSRGIHLPEGRPGDGSQADTAHGLASRKSKALERGLRRRGVTTVPGARRYLEAAGRAGCAVAVVSASTRTLPMLELAGLATLVEERVDADVIHAEGLRSRPAPDLLLAACRRLGVRPDEAVSFTHSPAGVAAGRAAGVAVVGVGGRRLGELLRGFGAERVVPALGVLLDRRLATRTG